MSRCQSALACSLFISLAALGCGGPVPDAPPRETRAPNGEIARPATDLVTLTLETRAGTSTLGYSFDDDALVPAEQAHLTITSSDCGARGRWVTLDARGVTVCPVPSDAKATADCPGWGALEIGGSDPGVAVGDTLVVSREGEPLARLTLRERTATPFDWFETADDPYVVVFERAPVR